MQTRHVKNLKVVKPLTLLSIINEVSEFFLKSNKQDGGINKKSFIMKKVQNQPEKIERLISMDMKFPIILVFKTEVLEVVTKVRKNVII